MTQSKHSLFLEALTERFRKAELEEFESVHRPLLLLHPSLRRFLVPAEWPYHQGQMYQRLRFLGACLKDEQDVAQLNEEWQDLVSASRRAAARASAYYTNATQECMHYAETVGAAVETLIPRRSVRELMLAKVFPQPSDAMQYFVALLETRRRAHLYEEKLVALLERTQFTRGTKDGMPRSEAFSLLEKNTREYLEIKLQWAYR